MDHEHNFIMQISGAKQLYTWDPFDREVFPEEGLELFHDHNSREKAVWKDSFRERATIIDLEPGVGGYMPSTTPHMVINGNEPSITISFTYYTNSTRRRELLYRANAHLRRMSISPTPVGRSKVRDEIKHSILSAYTGTRSLVRRALGRGVRVNSLPYAPVS
jgi:hypothetical protein